jgi:predicted TIM-barrel fold metal-dependent hydrolase
VKEIGAHRVLYGSDMPFHDPAFDMARIEYAKISDAEKKLVMGENAKKLLESLGK